MTEWEAVLVFQEEVRRHLMRLLSHTLQSKCTPGFGDEGKDLKYND